MDTKLITINNKNLEVSLNEAVDLLRNGEVVAFPTETVYGLAANALNGQAVNRIFLAKGRPSDNPLIVHVSDITEIDRFACNLPTNAKKLIDEFWPGPLTIVVPKKDIVPKEVTAGLGTVGIRLPKNIIARELIRKCGFPLAAPSANISGKPSPTLAQHVYDDFNGKIPLIIDGGQCDVGVESTVVSFIDGIPMILRPGDITAEQIKSVTGEVLLHQSILKPLDMEKVASPGMKYKHYSPEANITIVSGDEYALTQTIVKMYNDFNNNGKKSIIISKRIKQEYSDKNYKLLENSKIAAHELFSLLREIDKKKYDEIIFEAFDTSGIGLAVMNRLSRAAGFNIINV